MGNVVGLGVVLVVTAEDLFAVTCSDEDSRAACIVGHVNIGGFVANHEALGNVEVVFPGGGDEHSGVGFAPGAVAGVVGVGAAFGGAEVGAVVEGIQIGVGFVVEETAEAIVEGIHMAGGVVATGGARLVGDEAGENAAIVELADGLGHAGDEVEVFDFVDVASFDVENTIAIHEYGGVGHGENGEGIGFRE